MSDAERRWPPPGVGSGSSERPSGPPERHARWIDRERTKEEPREESPKVLWWILAGILVFAVFSVMIRMFLVL